MLKIVSLFTGAGGLDLGFEKAGFTTIWANEFDKNIWATFEHNFPEVKLDKRSITDVKPEEIPDCDGIIGGPPCQSWSEGGAGRGINDKRGQLFFDYIRILKVKQPKFFLVENVAGILHAKHSASFNNFLEQFEKARYNLSWQLVDANNYNVPENRLRVIIVGYRKDLNRVFTFPVPQKIGPVLKDAIWDLRNAKAAKDYNKSHHDNLEIPNHEYMNGGFSTIYMSRNRVRSWDEPSFTIQAGGRHAPLHPQAPKMKFISQNKRVFEPGHEDKYRRLSVRECARIQTFPDDFIFKYNDIADGYKMIGNAVPVNLALAIAVSIRKDLDNMDTSNSSIKGKAYEYACVLALQELVSQIRKIEVVQNESLTIAKLRYDNDISEQERSDMLLSARSGIEAIIDMEHRIIEDGDDELFISLQPDNVATKLGDIRDVLIIRRKLSWEIGVSVKHNHSALKHSRLSTKLDFGDVWVNVPCSQNYFNTIKPIFERLTTLKATKTMWNSLSDKETTVYLPILDAFKMEFENINDNNDGIAERLIKYLIGSNGKDYYKLIHNNNHTTTIMPFNLYGTLNVATNTANPKIIIPAIELPTKILDFSYKANSQTTLILTLDNGWSISFRIHNASSIVEPSLKFDIQLQSQPTNMFYINREW